MTEEKRLEREILRPQRIPRFALINVKNVEHQARLKDTLP